MKKRAAAWWDTLGGSAALQLTLTIFQNKRKCLSEFKQPKKYSIDISNRADNKHGKE